MRGGFPIAVKTAAGLAAHAKAQLDHYYWYGTFGQRPTLDLLTQKRKQYPNQMTAARYDYAKKNHVGRSGKRAFDCAGLVKSYWMMASSDSDPKYNAAYDKSAAGLKSCCKVKGKIGTIPEEPGILVFIGTSHVGVYLGGGQVAEARGFDYGVVQTALKARNWDTWGRLDWLEHEPSEKCSCAACKKAAPTTSQGASSGGLKAGDAVAIKKSVTCYYPGGPAVPGKYAGKRQTVTQVDYPKGSGKAVRKGGKLCVLLSEVGTWTAVDYLEKI